MNDETRPTITGTRADIKGALVQSLATSGGFDPDVWHIMDREDDALVADEVLNGALSGAFVYSFAIKGEPVQGISVIGAAHLARKYGGIKHRLVASVEKRGGLFKFVAYPAGDVQMQVSATYVREFEDDPDYYQALVEIVDVKTGNAVQAERAEMRFEKRRDGSEYERPNYSTIAQSKAYRNAVLRLIPQDVQVAFKAECVKLGKSKDVTKSVIDEARANIVTFAARHGITVSREAVFDLGMAEISGLRSAVQSGAQAFREAAAGLGLVAVSPAIAQQKPPPTSPTSEKPAVKTEPAAAAEHDLKTSEISPQHDQSPAAAAQTHDPETGEISPDEQPIKRGRGRSRRLFRDEG